MLDGTKFKGQSGIERLSRPSALWIMVSLAACSSDADVRGEEQGIETEAWESGSMSSALPDGASGVTAAAEFQDLTGLQVDQGSSTSTSSSTASSSSSPVSTSTAESQHNSASCLLPSDPANSTLPGNGGTTTTTTSQTPDSTTSSAPATTSISSTTSTNRTTSSSSTTSTSRTTSTSSATSTTTRTTTTTSPDDTSSAGGSGLCGNLPFDADWLRRKLSELTGATTTTLAGRTVRLGERSSSAGRENARRWLAEQYGRLGYRLQAHNYSSGTNVFAERVGSDDGVIIVSSHFDTVAGSPGADDDGSGVVVGLAVAAAMARCQPEKTVRFIAFDQEENGMIGSRAYVGSLQAADQIQRIAGMIQVEMVGYDQNEDGFINRNDCGRANSRFIADALSATVSNEGLGLTAIEACAGRSDHVPFWDINIPATTISQHFFGENQDRNRCYHRSCDVVANLNFDFMNRIARMVAKTTIALSDAR